MPVAFSGGKAEKPVTRFGDEHGVFSYKNALPEAKAEAEVAYPKVMEAGADGKAVDKNAAKRAEYTQEVIDRMKADHGKQATAAYMEPGDPFFERYLPAYRERRAEQREVDALWKQVIGNPRRVG